MNKQIQKLDHAQISAMRPGIDELKLRPRLPVCVILENIRSLYNVGSAFRTSDGALIEKLYLCGYTGFPPRKEIDKTSLGSVESVPWEHAPDTQSLILSLKSRGYSVVCLEHTDSSAVFTEAVYTYPLCLVLGNEVEGISPETIALCDSAIEIPMLGVKQSLNVAVAYGIAVYHIVGDYLKSKQQPQP
jgi:tRNA G18 (ribose-2'-O)-methylase SpoU